MGQATGGCQCSAVQASCGLQSGGTIQGMHAASGTMCAKCHKSSRVIHLACSDARALASVVLD